MRRNIRRNACGFRIGFQNFPEPLTAHRTSGTVDKQYIVLPSMHQGCARTAQILLQRLFRRSAERNDPLLAVRSGLRFRLFAAAFRAELAGGDSAATALPAVGGRSLLLGCCGLLTHSEQVLGVHAVCTGCHAHAHKAGHSTGGVPSSSLHGIDLTAHQTGCGGGGVGGHGVFFPLGDLLLLLLRDGQGVDVEGEHLDAALLAPEESQKKMRKAARLLKYA